MTDASYKVHCVIATLLMQMGPEDMTRNTRKVIGNYRKWVLHERGNNKERYIAMAKAAATSWDGMQADLDRRDISSLISLPVTLISLLDMLPEDKREHVVSPKTYMSMVESHTDHSTRTRDTEDAAIIVGELLREGFGILPRPSLSFIGQMKKTKEFNDILEGKQ